MSKASRKEIKLKWRTDFRIPATLPDIKVVRTNFIVNFVAVGLLVVACFILAQRELKVRNVNVAIDSLNNRITASTPANRANLELSRRFVEAGKKVEELQQFYENPFLPHQFLAELSMVRPDDIIFNQIQFQRVATPAAPAPRGRRGQPAAPVRPSYRIDIRGDVRELNILDQLKTILSELSYGDGSYSATIAESVQPRTGAGIFPYSIEIMLRPQ